MSAAASQINVTQPHTLGVEEAVARLIKGDGKPSFLDLLQVMIASLKLTKVIAEGDLGVPFQTIPLTVEITAGQVSVVSDGDAGVTRLLLEKAIAAKLSEALT